MVHQYTLHGVELAIGRFFNTPSELTNPAPSARLKNGSMRFSMTSSDGEPIALDWVGLEADFQNLWLYQKNLIQKPNFVIGK